MTGRKRKQESFQVAVIRGPGRGAVLQDRIMDRAVPPVTHTLIPCHGRPKQSHSLYCASRMRLGKETGLRLQGTQAECAAPPWMCSVPDASQPREDFRGQFRVGTSSGRMLLESDPPNTLGKALASFYRRILCQKSTRSGGINPQQDP